VIDGLAATRSLALIRRHARSRHRTSIAWTFSVISEREGFRHLYLLGIRRFSFVPLDLCCFECTLETALYLGFGSFGHPRVVGPVGYSFWGFLFGFCHFGIPDSMDGWCLDF
jgi:hypothetical protein